MARNPRQIEMAERMQEMDDYACEFQQMLIDKMGEQKFHQQGMPIQKFLAMYREKYKVGYASERYFKDKITVGKFFKTNPAHFKVSDTFYQEWLDKQEG